MCDWKYIYAQDKQITSKLKYETCDQKLQYMWQFTNYISHETKKHCITCGWKYITLHTWCNRHILHVIKNTLHIARKIELATQNLIYVTKMILLKIKKM
jgi:hypothetical protein